MESYEVNLKSSVEKDFRKIPKPIIAKILEVIESLESEPFPPKVTKLEGTEKTFRIRVGDYRIIYEIDSNTNIITILYVKHRREVYRNY